MKTQYTFPNIHCSKLAIANLRVKDVYKRQFRFRSNKLLQFWT